MASRRQRARHRGHLASSRIAQRYRHRTECRARSGRATGRHAIRGRVSCRLARRPLVGLHLRPVGAQRGLRAPTRRRGRPGAGLGEGGSEPVWNRNGRELFYRAGPGGGTELVAAALVFEPGPSITGRTTLFRVAGMANGTPHANYDVSPDGRTFVMVGFNQASRIVIIQNLPALIAKLRGEGGSSP